MEANQVEARILMASVPKMMPGFESSGSGSKPISIPIATQKHRSGSC